MNTARMSGTCSGIGTTVLRTCSAGTRMYSANPPGSMFERLNCGSIVSLPRRDQCEP